MFTCTRAAVRCCRQRHEHGEIMYSCDNQHKLRRLYNDENDEQTMDLSLYDVERLRDYLEVKEEMIYDMPTDGWAI
eukprot:4732251-Heterocapsa_arctica.AAC.1